MTHTRRGGRMFPAAARALLCAVAAGILGLSARPDGRAADKGEAEASEFVPADAAAVVSIRWAECWDHPALKAGLHAYMKELPGALDSFRRYYGVGPEDVDRQILFSQINPHVLGPYGPSLEPCIVVTTRKPYDRQAVLDAAAPGAREEKINDRTYYSKDGKLCCAFLDDRTYVIGQEPWMRPYLSLPAVAKEGPMAPVLKLAAEKHLIVAGANIDAIARGLPPADKLPPEFKPFKPLLQAQVATLTVDLDERFQADLKATFKDDAGAKQGTAALNDALDLVRGGLVAALVGWNQFEEAPKLTALMHDAQAAVRAAKAEQDGASVQLRVAMKIDAETTAGATVEAVDKIRTAVRKIMTANDLKQLAIAVHAYHDSHGHFPPAAVYDANGKPLLSWRVLLLPYLDGEQLYKEFHLDEPWDGEHNKKLLEKMPEVFAPPDSEAFKDHETFFQGLVGEGSVFEGKNPNVTMTAITTLNGTSNTILFVEAAKSVPWTKPEDVSVDQGKLVPKFGGLSKGGFLAVFCDGSVRFLPLTVDEAALHRAASFKNTEPFSLEP